METFEPEVIPITTEQILQELKRMPLGALIQAIRNCGDIQDRSLRRVWCTAKRAIDSVESHLKQVVAEKNASNGPKPS